MSLPSAPRDRKKGMPWTEEEHRMFLVGLEKLGKGDWKGIARGFVTTRTPTQVASHAQKYFIRRSNLSTRRKRSSLFDMTSGNNERGDGYVVQKPILSKRPELKVVPCTDMKMEVSSNSSCAEDIRDVEGVTQGSANGAIVQARPEAFMTMPEAYYALLLAGWSGGFLPSSASLPSPAVASNVVRPTPILPTSPVHLDVWNAISDVGTFAAPPPPSLKLSEHSAFHANPSSYRKNIDRTSISVV